MDLEKAYEIIGIKRSATLDELEERFFILNKREKAKSANNNLSESDEKNNLKEINEAYQLIKKEIVGEEDNSDASFKEKVDHIFYHYKFAIIGGILAILLVGTFLVTLIDKQIERANQVPASLAIALMGEYNNADLTSLEDNVSTNFPMWEYVKVQLIYSPKIDKSQQDPGSVIKQQAQIVEAQPDIFILDEYQYELLVGNGSFIPLEELSDDFRANINESLLLFNQTKENSEEKLYGINITNSKLFNNTGLNGEKIAVIREGADHIDNAITFLLKTVESVK